MRKEAKYAIMAALAITFQGCYVAQVDTGEAGVEKKWGEIKNEVIGPGLHVNFTPGADLVTMNVKTKRLEMKNATKSKKDTVDAMFDRSVTVLSKNGLPVPVEMTVLYRLKEKMAPEVLGKYGPDVTWDDKLVVPQVRDIAREVMGNVDIYELNKNRNKYSTEIVERLNEKIGKYVLVENVMIKEIGIPRKIREAIERKMQMKENAERAKYEVEKAKQEAEKKIAVARGEAERRRIAADAKAYQIAKEAEAQAKANVELSRSITPDLVKYQWVMKWDGKVPKVQAGNGIGIFVKEEDK